MTTNFKYLEQQILKRTQSPLQLTWESDFSGFQAANHCHKSAKLGLPLKLSQVKNMPISITNK